jgi:hypothetical protein
MYTPRLRQNVRSGGLNQASRTAGTLRMRRNTDHVQPHEENVPTEIDAVPTHIDDILAYPLVGAARRTC